MKSFFEYLEKNNLGDPSEIAEKIFKLPLNKVIKILENCYYLINLNRSNLIAKNIFDFSANTSLSGGIYPCSCIECRIEKVYNLSVFASLYADTVLIPNFFEYFYHSSFDFKNQEQEFFFRNRIVGDITAFLYFKPLIETGIIRVNPTEVFVCESCLSKLLKKEKKLNQKFDLIKEKLEPKLIKKINFILDTPFSIIIQNDCNYTNYEVIQFAILPDELNKYVRKIPYKFSAEEIKKLDLVELILKPTFNDLMLQKYSINAYKLSYLTDKKIDSEIIEAINSEDKNYNSSIVNGLVHSLPFLNGVDIKKVLKIRNEENNVFESYRCAVRNIIRETKSKNNKKFLKEAMENIIVPEITKIENVISNNKKYFRKKANNKIIFSAIAMSIGIIGNKMGIDNQIIQIFAPFVGRDIYNDLISASNIPIEARNNNYYFLWKIKNKIKSNPKRIQWI